MRVDVEMLPGHDLEFPTGAVPLWECDEIVVERHEGEVIMSLRMENGLVQVRAEEKEAERLAVELTSVAFSKTGPEARVAYDRKGVFPA